ncbi:MAG: dienelactone hydrolase family protein [Acidimicrobiia bacterium]|nr:dienelactone hydrolase family protein [Acidimicrobiia bacterium]
MTDFPTRAPKGELDSFEKYAFTHDGATHDVYRKGTGPVVMVITEMPGLSPYVLGFADRVAALGLTVVCPDLFGQAGRDPFIGSKAGQAGYMLSSWSKICISREFTSLAIGRSSPVVGWLRALAHQEHERAGGPGVGAVGMCFTGGFALAMAVDPLVLAPVVSQPSLPIGITKSRKRSIDSSDADLETVRLRCVNEGLQVLGLRFDGDPFVPAERFDFLRERLGDGFVAVELRQEDGHPDSALGKAHSVLTGDLIDEPGQPSRAALDQVLDLFRSRLLAPTPS